MPRPFSHNIYADETHCVESLLDSLPWNDVLSARTRDRAMGLVESIRARKIPAGQLESFLQRYSLSTDEGIALMCLAESLLRIPDRKTANDLIRDKIAGASWSGGSGADWVVNAAGFGLVATRRTLDSALSRIGAPFIREAMQRVLRMMGAQFVLGEDIESAAQSARKHTKKGYRISYDILGEGARTSADADRYFENYKNAIDYIGQRKEKDYNKRAGISVKLSALHPRYIYAQKERCVPELISKLSELARAAAAVDIPLTVDAEEADRLELSLDIFEGVLDDPALIGWDGFGLAIQAYQKRASRLVDYISEIARVRSRRIYVRLVKGAYWDTEIKRAQVLGLHDFPVFTRKANTDLSYMACAYKLLTHADHIFPMFGTHNAHTVAAIMEMAGDLRAKFEFQRLHGMGEALFDTILEEGAVPVSIYAPVGPYEDLLAYLVRRLLENGANSSFVHQVMNPDAPVENIVRDPVDAVRNALTHRHTRIALPSDLYIHEGVQGRRNAAGVDLSDPQATQPLIKDIKNHNRNFDAPALIGGKFYKDLNPRDIQNPANTSEHVGRFWPASAGLVDKAFRVAGEAFTEWKNTSAESRAVILDKFADALEERRAEFMALCVREAGKTIPDALAEIREAVDFARYYAARGREQCADIPLPGPVGESNIMRLEGRGVFVCISPWNFPLAIFSGQVTAALMAGNCVIAKPAEQTPLIALRAVQLLHECGVPENVLNFLPGDGVTGAAAVAHADVAGVAFTGSTAVAREINMTLSKKSGAIVPLIAETGGQNAMIVDSSALPEQVIDDVMLSAFGSAGQRCSSLRVLFLQNDIADKVLRLLQGAMAGLEIGNPALLSTDIGPVIDDEALARLTRHREAIKGFGRLIYEVPLPPNLRTQGYFFAPAVYELNDMTGLREEVFGPVLHVIRYKAGEIKNVIEQINATGYGLTVGVHSRIDGFQQKIARDIRAGNAYINRSMIGAVVGTQPFGGQGLSGTGPKAGGPHYIARFATERVISTNTAAAGGNAALVSMGE